MMVRNNGYKSNFNYKDTALTRKPRTIHRSYCSPTEDAAIANVMREEWEKKQRERMAQKEQKVRKARLEQERRLQQEQRLQRGKQLEESTAMRRRGEKYVTK